MAATRLPMLSPTWMITSTSSDPSRAKSSSTLRMPAREGFRWKRRGSATRSPFSFFFQRTRLLRKRERGREREANASARKNGIISLSK